MKINSGLYTVNRTPIKQFFLKQGFYDLERKLSVLSVSTGVPIIVVCIYFKDMFPDIQPELLDNMLVRLKTFYKVTEVL